MVLCKMKIFGICTVLYLVTFYTSSLWTAYMQRAVNALRVQYNNAFRMLLRLPPFCSASAMFMEARTDGFAAILRKKAAAASLLHRMHIIYVVDVCDAACDEYFVVLEEHSCSDGSRYRITPLKREAINWDSVIYPCNSTLEDPGKEKCLVEFDCMGSVGDCQDRKKDGNKQSHYFIGDNQTAKHISIRTEAPDVTASNITDVTEESHHNNNQTAKPISISTEAPDVTASNITDVTEKSHHNNNQTAKPSSISTEAPDLTASNITDMTEASHHNNNQTAKPISISTEVPDVKTNNITNVTEESHHNNNQTVNPISISTEAPDVITRNVTDVSEETHHNYNQTAKPISISTESTDVTASNVTDVTEESHHNSNQTAKTISISTEVPDVKTNNITNVTEESHHNNNQTVNQISISTEAPDVTASNVTDVTEESHHNSNQTAKTISIRTEAPDVTTSKITDVTKESHHNNNQTAKPISISTEAPNVTASNITDVTEESHHNNNQTAKPISISTKAPDVITSNITDVTEKSLHTLDEEFTASMYDLNLIYINENDIQNSLETNSKTTRNETLYCDYAETVCFGEMKPENTNSSDFNNITYNTDINEPARTLQISIDRDFTSSVQPIFTGYFTESSNDSSKNYNGNFKYLKTMSTPCSIPKYNNCKENIRINIYFKANYIENNTITKYPNCTKDSIASENVLNVKCEDISFAKHNRHIIQTPPTAPPKQEMWTCQIKELIYPILSSKGSENNKLHFINCSNETNNNIIKSEDTNVTAISDSNNITISSNLTKNGIELNKMETFIGIEKLNKDNSSHTNLQNVITILVTENTNNCSHNISLNIDEGKIIDFGVNKTDEKILQNNVIELKLASCIDVHSSITNGTHPDSKVDLTIILKNESLNAANLKLFNGSLKDENVKQRILLRCEHPNFDSSSNATSDKTIVYCESIDLDLNNITGIEENTKVKQTSNINKEQKKENVNRFEVIGNKTKLNAEMHKNGKLITNKTIENNVTVNNKSHENNTKVIKNKEKQKDNSETEENHENKEVNKTISGRKEISINQIFNRKKDIPNSAEQSSLALGLGSPETEKVLLITLLSMVGTAILMVIAWRICPKKRKYDPAPTREPPNEEETAF